MDGCTPVMNHKRIKLNFISVDNATNWGNLGADHFLIINQCLLSISPLMYVMRLVLADTVDPDMG